MGEIVQTGGVGVRDGRFEDGVDVGEVADDYALIEEVEAATGDACGSGSGEDGSASDSYVSGGPGDVDGEGVLVGFGRGVDDGFEFKKNYVAVGFDDGGDDGERGKGLSVGFGDATSEVGNDGLERDDDTSGHTGSMS